MERFVLFLCFEVLCVLAQDSTVTKSNNFSRAHTTSYVPNSTLSPSHAINKSVETTSAAAAAAEGQTKFISSEVSYLTSTVRENTTSPPNIDLNTTLKNLSVKLNNTPLITTAHYSTPGSSTLKDNTFLITTAHYSTPGSSTLKDNTPLITTTRTPDMVSTAESESITPVISQSVTSVRVTAYTPSETIKITDSEGATATMSRITKRATQNVTLAPTTSTSVRTNETSKNKTFTTKITNYTAITYSVTSSFTRTYVTSSKGATETPRNFTTSSNKSVTFIPGVTVTTIVDVFPVNATMFPNKSLTSSHIVTGGSSSSFVAWTTSVTHAGTSTQPPSTTPRTITTTKPTSKPKIEGSPKEHFTVDEGQNLEMRCNATGSPQPVIVWKKNNNLLKNTNRVMIKSDNTSITILKTTRNDAGKYQCNASNGVGWGVAKYIYVKITYFSGFHIDIVEPKGRPIVEGITVKLRCSVDSNSGPILQWRKDGEKFHSKQVKQVSLTEIKKISRANGGNYTCLTQHNGFTIATSILIKVQVSNTSIYRPLKELEKTAKTIKIPIYKITYLENGKKVSYVQVIVVQLEEKRLPERETYSYKPSELGPHSTNRTKLYIAAIIFLEDLKGAKTGLVLGDGSKSFIPKQARRRRNARDDDKEYHNAPLRPDTFYTAFQRMVASDEDHESLDWIPPTKTMHESPVSSSKKGSNLGTILWILLVLFILLIAVVVGISIYIFKNHKSQNLDVDGVEMRPGKNALGKMARTLSFHMARLHEHYHPSGPIPVENFQNHVTRMHKSGDMHFSTEYEKIPEYDDIPATHSIDPANQWKNRYSNIVAYDYNRVKLVPFDDEPASDYINASYINGYNNEKTYIAAQGPLDETCGDFWRMVWEQNTKVIVMLTNVRERGRLKCSQYWPTSGTTRFEAAYVSLEHTVEMTSYTIRVFRVAMTGQKETRTIKQFHFTSWPDHGVPKSATFLLAFVRETVKANPSDAGPMVVHCSAGVGRTGTFLVIDSMLQQIAKDKTVDILNFVIQLRKQRNMMVQTEQQYIFTHDALLDVIISGETEVHASKLRNHFQEMIEPNKETGENNMSLEFQRLTRGVRPHYTFTAATIPANKCKNRYANTLPFDDTRVQLVVRVAVNGSDYINANYIDAYMKKRAFIATQAPLPDTFDDFWRMIWEQKCYTIVALAQEVENTKLKMNRYWPTTHPITFGELQVELLEEEKEEFQETRVFNITNTVDNKSQIVHQFHYTEWTSEDPSDSGINLLNMIEQINQWQDASGNHVITVHCSAGVGRTGVFCAVSSLIERLKAEAVVDVFQTVKQLREQRPAMVQTKSQYEFCYSVLLEYLDTHTYLEEMDSSPDLPEPDNTGNPPLIEEEQKETSENHSSESAIENIKCGDADDASTSISLNEGNQKDLPNQIKSNSVTPEHPESSDVTPEDKARDIPAQNDETHEPNSEPQTATPQNVSTGDVKQEDDANEDVTPKNGTLEDIKPKNITHENVTDEKITDEDVTPKNVTIENDTATSETGQKMDNEGLANHTVDNSSPILQRANSEESDPYVSPLSSNLDLNS